jgi:RNA polymerase sigma-70 factor (ECF subfamily)
MSSLAMALPESVAAFARRHRAQVVAYAFRFVRDAAEAEDVVQEVFLRLLKQADAPTDERALAGWVYAVTYRLAIDHCRRKKRRRQAAEAVAEAVVEDAAAEADRPARLQAGIYQLEEPYRTALVLRYLEGRSFPDVARAMNTLERTARTWVGRGLTKLRLALSVKP